MKNQIKNPQFFTGGNATFTVYNNSGDHYTFKIRQKKDTPMFVSMLTGPDNWTNYSYVGLYNPAQLALRLTTKSKMNAESKPVRVFNWAIKTVAERKELPAGYGIVHEGKCCRCGRKLTTPESVENGIGPECIKHFA